MEDIVYILVMNGVDILLDGLIVVYLVFVIVVRNGFK